MTILRYFHVMYIPTVYFRIGIVHTKPCGVLYRDKLLKDIKRKV